MSWRDRAVAVEPALDNNWRSRASVPVDMDEEAPTLAPMFEQAPATVQLAQMVANSDEDMARFIGSEGYEILPMQGKGIVFKDKAGKIYDTGETPWLVKNALDAGLSLGAAALTGGASLPSMAAGSGIRGLIGMGGRLAARAGFEGLGNSGAELLRQGIGVGAGVNEGIDSERAMDAGIAGASAPLVSKGLSAFGTGARKTQQLISGVPNDVNDLVRRSPEILNLSTKENVDRGQLAFTKKLAEQGRRAIDISAEEQAQAVLKSNAYTSPQMLLNFMESVDARNIRPLTESTSALEPLKRNLKKRLTRYEDSTILDASGKPFQVEIPETLIDASETSATKQSLQDAGFRNPLDPSDYRERVSKDASRVFRNAETDMLDIQGQIGRERLHKINMLKEQYPSLARGIDANEEQQLQDLLFKPSRESAVTASMRSLDDLIGEGSDLSLDYGNLIKMRKVLQNNKAIPAKSGYSAILLPALASAVGSTGGAGGLLAGGAAGMVAQAPGTTLKISQLLGYLDRMAAKGGGKVGKGANALREAALMEMME